MRKIQALVMSAALLITWSHKIMAHDTLDSNHRESRKLTANEELIFASKSHRLSLAILTLINPVVGALAAYYEESSNNIANINRALAMGANIDWQEESSGYTALIYGAYEGYPGIVRHLIDLGANAQIKEKSGYNAYTMARYYFQKYTKTIESLKEKPLDAHESWEQRQQLIDRYKNYTYRYAEIMSILDSASPDKTMPTNFWGF